MGSACSGLTMVACRGEPFGSRLAEPIEWAGDRVGDEGDAPAVHDGYKGKIVREANACKKAGRGRGIAAAGGAILLPPDDLTRGPPVTRVPDPRDKRIADMERENPLWQRRAERAEA